MANLKKHLGNMRVNSGQRKFIKIEYDFANDGGAVSFLAGFVAKEKLVVHDAVLTVQTTCTSGGSATVSLGKTGSVAAFVAATAVASLVGDAVITGVAGLGANGIIMAVDDEIGFDIAVAALTAGKIIAQLEVSSFT